MRESEPTAVGCAQLEPPEQAVPALTLAAVATAVPCARLFTTHCLRRLGIRGLVLAHLGRPTRAGELPPFGEFGEEARR